MQYLSDLHAKLHSLEFGLACVIIYEIVDAISCQENMFWSTYRSYGFRVNPPFSVSRLNAIAFKITPTQPVCEKEQTAFAYQYISRDQPLRKANSCAYQGLNVEYSGVIGH